jgi:type IV secretion system protein VirD4
MTLADALVYDAPGEAGEAHWNEEAKALIAGILHIGRQRAARGEAHARHPARLPHPRPRQFRRAAPGHAGVTQAAAGLIARAANRHLGKSDREAAGVLSAAQRHTHFLDSPAHDGGARPLGFHLCRSQGAQRNRLPGPAARSARHLFPLAAPARRAKPHRHGPRPPASPARPVLYLLDEFAALGHLAPVERAMGLMAGYGVQLWPILQDVHQLRATYGSRAGTFLSNAGVLQVFGVNDHDSARLVSDLLGQETVVFETMSRALDSEETGISYGEQHVGRPLLTPDEVRNLPQHAELLFLAGQRPIVAGKLAYYADPEFRGLYDAA